MAGNTYYSTPDQYAGKSLSDIRNETNGSFRPDVLAAMLGISDNQALTAGQQLTYSGNDPGSGEQKALSQYFGQGKNESQYQQDQYSKAVQPSIDTLNSQVDPLKSRYDQVIKDIQAQRGLATQKASTSQSREAGARGISTNSSAYDQMLATQITPIDTQYGSLETNAAGEEQDRLNAIKSAIANLQTQASFKGLDTAQAITAAQKVADEAARQFDAQQGLAQSKYDYEKSQASAPDYSKQYTNVPEGNTLYDLLNQNAVYKNGKTTAGGGNSGW